MLTQHLQKLRHAVTVQRTFPRKHLQNASYSSMNCISLQTIWSSLIQSLLQSNLQENKHRHSANQNECAEIFFSTAQGTQAPMLAINTSFFYTNHIKRVVAGKEEWERNYVVYFYDVLKNSFLLKKSTLAHVSQWKSLAVETKKTFALILWHLVC